MRFSTGWLKRKDLSKDVKGTKFPCVTTVLNAFQIIFEYKEKMGLQSIVIRCLTRDKAYLNLFQMGLSVSRGLYNLQFYHFVVRYLSSL